MNKKSFLAGVIVTVGCYFAWSEFFQNHNIPGTFDDSAKGASESTQKANQAVFEDLPFEDSLPTVASDGLLTPFEKNIEVETETGMNVVWNREDFEFLDSMEVKPYKDFTVNPSLLRQAKLNNEAGLYKIRNGVYQVRGLDLAVMSFIRGENGWIVVDPLTSKETAAKGMELFFEYLGSKDKVALKDAAVNRVVSAVIFTHSHIDHFGGVFGVLDEKNSESVPVYAPEGFFEEAVSENVLAGNLMGRRASYMYGNLIEAGPKGKVDGGLGKTTSTGAPGIIEPEKQHIVDDNVTIPVDGIDFEFQMANGSEAPAEFMFYVGRYRLLMAAEVITNTIHNISSLRGARTRDARAWVSYIDSVLERFGDKSDVMIASHHWPTKRQSEIVKQLEKTRDSYKFVHDQVLRLANKGYTPNEISAQVALPDSLRKEWYNRGYYGTVSHNARATYDFYFGAWWDGNPANLNPLSPEEEGKRYVEALGGAERVLRLASRAMDDGEYQWVVRLLNNLVFAEPQNMQARYLAADAMEQMGYQAESGPWRNYYLGGAKELRFGLIKVPTVNTTGIASNMTPLMALDSLAVRVNPAAEIPGNIAVDDMNTLIHFTLVGKDRKLEVYTQKLSNSVLKTYEGDRATGDDTGFKQVNVQVSKTEFGEMLSSIVKHGNCDTFAEDHADSIDDVDGLKNYCQVFEVFPTEFGIATPYAVSLPK
ncbi:alkyl/aryl-sulfatase [Endozoicomonadaceae bacterium StTr2]